MSWLDYSGHMSGWPTFGELVFCVNHPNVQIFLNYLQLSQKKLFVGYPIWLSNLPVQRNCFCITRSAIIDYICLALHFRSASPQVTFHLFGAKHDQRTIISIGYSIDFPSGETQSFSTFCNYFSRTSCLYLSLVYLESISYIHVYTVYTYIYIYIHIIYLCIT